MIWAILLLAAGLLIAAASLLLRKRTGRVWMFSLLAGGILVAACGGFFTAEQFQEAQSRRESIYLGLCYLKQRQIDSAAFYFRKAGPVDTYEAAASRCLLEQVRGNDLNARLNLDAAKSMARSKKENSLLAVLEQASVEDSSYLTLTTSQLEEMLRISQARKNTLDLYVQVETGQIQDLETAQSAGLDRDGADRLAVSMLLGQGSYETAVERAARLADRSPSADNRLLLAEAVAESAYQNVPLSEYVFIADTQNKPDSSAQKERSSLDARREKAEEKLALLSIMEDDSKAEEKLKLTEQIRELQKRSDKLYVYRAFNAIADIHSLEAELVRARLHFALQESEQAVQTLLDAAKSLNSRITADRSLADSLRIVEKTYKDGTAFFDNQEFRDAMTQLLSSPFPDLMYVGQSQLTQDFIQQIVNDQKTYGRGLVISGLDASRFPVISVTLSGREDILQEVVERSEVVSRDTRREVSYTAQMDSGSYVDVCILVDRSGSMDGEPMNHLKNALTNFIGELREGTSMSLVAFDDGAEQLTGLTSDQTLLLQKTGSLSAYGGTNITAGIQKGLDAMNNAGGSRVMLLMTDGQSNIDLSVVDRAAQAGIVIHTIGFGGVNSSLLEEIAARTQGQYIYADSSSELNGIYASLQQIMGNLVTLEYTIENTEVVENRYFYLKAGGYSVRLEYRLPQTEPTPVIYSSQPSLISPSELQRIRENGRTLSLLLSGDKLQEAEAVFIGENAVEIVEQENTFLRLEIPPDIGRGWQTIAVRMADGREISFNRLLLVGEVQSFNNIRLGSLFIPYGQGILPGDGTLVLGGSMSIRENTGEHSTLDLTMEGTLILPWASGGTTGGAAPTSNLNLGNSGTVSGWGRVYLGRSDGAFENSAPQTVAQGAFELECGSNQSRLKQEVNLP